MTRLNHQTDLVRFDCCVCFIAIPRMSTWACASGEDLDAWNSKRVLSSPLYPPPHSPPIFVETLPISDSVCCCIKMKSLPPTCRPPPTPNPHLSLAPWLHDLPAKWGESLALAARDELSSSILLFLLNPAFLSCPVLRRLPPHPASLPTSVPLLPAS